MPMYRMRIDDEPAGLLTRVALAVLSLIVLVVSAFLGVFIFLAVLGFVAIAGAVLAVRLWLLKRHIDKNMSEGVTGDRGPKDYIDVEYHEVKPENDERR